MRLPGLACCTLTAIAAGGLAAQASETSDSDVLALDPATQTHDPAIASKSLKHLDLPPSAALPDRLDAPPETLETVPEMSEVGPGTRNLSDRGIQVSLESPPSVEVPVVEANNETTAKTAEIPTSNRKKLPKATPAPPENFPSTPESLTAVPDRIPPFPALPPLEVLFNKTDPESESASPRVSAMHPEVAADLRKSQKQLSVPASALSVAAVQPTTPPARDPVSETPASNLPTSATLPLTKLSTRASELLLDERGVPIEIGSRSNSPNRCTLDGARH
jgi:hypothetical protein